MSDFPVYFDNIIFSLQRVGGISVYWAEMIKRMISSKDRFFMFEHGLAANNLSRRELPVDMPGVRREKSFLPEKILRYLPLQASLEGPGLFHSGYYRSAPQKDIANIISVHDFTYERFRQGLPRRIHSWQKRKAVQQADGIICISHSTKRDLLHYCPECIGKDIKVIHLGASEVFRVLSDLPPIDEKIREIIDGKYAIFVGARAGYKNFAIAVDVIEQISDCKLLLVGGGELSAVEQEELTQKLSGRYYHLQGIDDALLNVLYNKAFCLLYPSSYEGFGIPVVEAMSAGCPVVAVAVSSIPEVSGEAGLLVDEPSVQSLSEKINLLGKESFRREVIQKCRDQASVFSWDRCYQETRQFYDHIFENKFVGLVDSTR